MPEQKLVPKAPPSGATVRQRRTGGSGNTGGSSGSSGGTVRRAAASSSNTAGMFRFYTEDSPGIKVGPVPVLVLSLVFIASVFILHIWGKYNRG